MGTFVTITIDGGHAEHTVHTAISEAFDGIARIDTSMTRHDPMSELSQINLQAHTHAMPVSSDLAIVLETALALFDLTNGAFDVTMAAGTSADIVLQNGVIQFKHPLSIDLGGIAKGFAVDHAVETLLRLGHASGSVSAGGDIRIFGDPNPTFFVQHNTTHLIPWTPKKPAVATSLVMLDRSKSYTHATYRNLPSAGAPKAVSVAANSCMIADALTKIVIALGDDSMPILTHFKAVSIQSL